MAELLGTGLGEVLEGTYNEANTIDALEGDDTLIGKNLIDRMWGGKGNDVLVGGAGADELDGEAGDDSIRADSGNDRIVSGSGNDTIYAGDGNDSIYLNDGERGDVKYIAAGAGDDYIFGGLGADELIGGVGRDTVDFAYSAAVFVDLLSGVGFGSWAEGDRYYSIEDVFGSRNNDTLIGNASANKLLGQEGDDRIQGGAGADYLDGGLGSDTIDYRTSSAAVRIDLAAKTVSGGHAQGDTFRNFENVDGSEFSDVFYADAGSNALDGRGGNDALYGRAGNDVVIGGSGQDRLDGGTGTDTASYATASAGVVASLAVPTNNTNDAKGDTYYSIENLFGSRFNDLLVGNTGMNVLTGGDGHDTLIGGAGADELYGGKGSDAASYSNSAAGVIANLVSPSGNSGEAKGDSYSSIENLIGSKYSDKFYGTGGANSISGGGGNDTIAGGGGNDWIYGGAGADHLFGGTGADKFVFKAFSESAGTTFDSIFDFMTSEQDSIDLSAIDASNLAAGNQAFAFIGTAAFSGTAGQLRCVKQASDTYIYGDVNGDRIPDLKIYLDDAVALTKDFFIL